MYDQFQLSPTPDRKNPLLLHWFKTKKKVIQLLKLGLLKFKTVNSVHSSLMFLPQGDNCSFKKDKYAYVEMTHDTHLHFELIII